VEGIDWHSRTGAHSQIPTVLPLVKPVGKMLLVVINSISDQNSALTLMEYWTANLRKQ
jgi:hypothetical protein